MKEMIMSQRDLFMARLAKNCQAGLTDLKFFFHPSRPMNTEEIFGAMNRVDDAVKTAQRHSSWKGDEPAE
jgi:hypothetical protein